MNGLKILYWAPRLLGIVITCFLAIFALDVFEPGKTLGYYFVAFFMHLLPNFALLGLTILSWKHEKFGGFSFILLALLFTVFFHTYEELIPFLVVSFPVFLIGTLFLLHHSLQKSKT